VLYEMVAGRPPFSGSNAISVLHLHLVADPPPVTDARPDAPSRLVSVLAPALAKTPDDRYATALEFRSAAIEAWSHSVGLADYDAVSVYLKALLGKSSAAEAPTDFDATQWG